MKLIFSLLTLLLACQSYAQPTKIRHLVIEGAGIRGIAYAGALAELEKNHLLDSLTHVAGTSSGAITASLYAVGYTPEELLSIIGQTRFETFNDGSWGALGGIWRITHRMGWYPGDQFQHWLENLIVQKTGIKDLTFAQLHELAIHNPTYRSLFVGTTSINHQKTLVLSHESFPNMRIADAVRASMAVPFYFEPVIFDADGQCCEWNECQSSDHICLDGGLTANYLIHAFDSLGADHTLGLRIDSEKQIALDHGPGGLEYQAIRNSSDLTVALFILLREEMNRQQLTQTDWNRTISISDAGIGPKVKFLSNSQKDALTASGSSAVENYFTGLP